MIVSRTLPSFSRCQILMPNAFAFCRMSPLLAADLRDSGFIGAVVSFFAGWKSKLNDLLRGITWFSTAFSNREGLIVCGGFVSCCKTAVDDGPAASVEVDRLWSEGIDRVVITCVTSREKNFSSRYIARVLVRAEEELGQSLTAPSDTMVFRHCRLASSGIFSK